MEIIIVKPFGYCFGVNEALKELLNIKNNNPNKKIYTLGTLIHNEEILNLYKNNDISVVDESDLNQLECDSVVVFSAHGHAKKLEDILIKKNIKFYSTTCTYIKKIYDLIDTFDESNCIYIGLKNHQEGKAILNNYKNIIFYDLNEGILDKTIDLNKTYHLINQSTIDQETLIKINKILNDKKIKIKPTNTTCDSLLVRYKNMMNLPINKEIYVLVVGSKTSNNANILLNIYQNRTKYSNCSLINSSEELKDINLKNINKIYLVSSTSSSLDQLNEIAKVIKETYN